MTLVDRTIVLGSRQAIAGIEQALIGVKAGGYRKVRISPHLAYRMEAALDISEQWVRKKFPEKEDHEHCLFTWEKIGAGSSNDEGYHSKYRWITVDAYKMHICDDIYRLRD